MRTEVFQNYYQETKNFRISNPNPRWKEKRGFLWDTSDCCVRALANATGCTWLEAYDFLSEKARRDFSVLNDGRGFRRWLSENGGIWTHLKAERGKKRKTVLEFAQEHPKGKYIIAIAGHETACVDGVILDVWNCGKKCVVGYVDMNNFSFSPKFEVGDLIQYVTDSADVEEDVEVVGSRVKTNVGWLENVDEWILKNKSNEE